VIRERQVTNPTVAEVSARVARAAARLRWWRTNEMVMRVSDLATAIGYSPHAIYRFERGYNAHGKPFGARAWKRYEQACAALAQQKGKRGPCGLQF
jgi:hypothetical protein